LSKYLINILYLSTYNLKELIIIEDKIFEGLWDCKYCGTTEIKGLNDYCPNCGKSKDINIKYYFNKDLTKELTDEYLFNVSITKKECDGKHPDWICNYCGNLNKFSNKVCSTCGAVKENDIKNYFNNKVKNKINKIVSNNSYITNKNDYKLFEIKFKYLLYFLLIVITIFITCFLPFKTEEEIITNLGWEYITTMEEYVDVDKSGWVLPNDAILKYTKEEIRKYEKVFSHIETKTRIVYEKVQDGYEIETYIINNGNGTFTEKTSQVPKYKIVEKEELYQEPVYIDKPIYNIKYYYTVKEWVKGETYKNEGKGKIPIISSEVPKETEILKIKNNKIKYFIYFNNEKKEITEEYFYNLNINDIVYYKKSLIGIKVSNFYFKD